MPIVPWCLVRVAVVVAPTALLGLIVSGNNDTNKSNVGGGSPHHQNEDAALERLQGGNKLYSLFIRLFFL